MAHEHENLVLGGGWQPFEQPSDGPAGLELAERAQRGQASASAAISAVRKQRT